VASPFLATRRPSQWICLVDDEEETCSIAAKRVCVAAHQALQVEEDMLLLVMMQDYKPDKTAMHAACAHYYDK
jgi:hypothetical protein